MHDIDRVRLEMAGGKDPYAGEGFEYEGGYLEDEYAYDEFEFDGDPDMEAYYDEYEDEDEYEYEGDYESGSPLSDSEEMELAADLLEVMDEDELEQFLGKLFKKVSRRVRKAIPSSIRRKVGSHLKTFARHGLGIAGTAVGGPIGGLLASGAGRALGLEMEGLSPEDQEYEVARRFTRLAAEAAAQAANTAPGASPEAAARRAISAAIQKNAPGMIRPGMTARRRPAKGRRGTWVRRGNTIILHGVFR